MRHRLLILGLLATLLIGCSLYDERDECCGVTLHFRYMETGQDVFKDHIRTMRHFLFDGEGLFLREIVVSKTENKLFMQDIDDGLYTMITIANPTTANTALTHLEERVSRLEDFSLALAEGDETRTCVDSYYDNADELFYNATQFEVTPEDRDFYFEDLSNTHCHLHVYLYWKKLPDYRGSFTMRLYDVPADFALSPDSMRRVMWPADEPSLIPTAGNTVQMVPRQMNRLVNHEVEVQPYNFKLMGELITHRWTDDHIPVLQVFNDEQKVTARIILSQVFQKWGISPDADPVQDYWIEIEVYPDGTSHVGRYVGGKVNDWVDGGTISR